MPIVIDAQKFAVGFGVGLPALTYLYLFFVSRPRWIRSAPPPKVGDEPTPPQKVSPALAGLFVDARLGEEEMTGTIVDLMQRGYLTIIEKGDRVVILKKKKPDDLPPFERTIANHLLARGTIAKSDLEIAQRINRKLYDEHISEALRTLYREGVEHGVFFEDPTFRYAWYYLTGLLIFFLGIISAALLFPTFGTTPTLLFYPLGLILSGTTITSRAKKISALSTGGKLIQEVWRDYKKELVEFRPGGDSSVFAKYLPFAFALGAERGWARRWKDRPFTTPDWFATFKTPSHEEFVGELSRVVGALARDLFALRDPALKD